MPYQGVATVAKRSNKRGFSFDVGFQLDGPPEITPAVEQATQDMLKLVNVVPDQIQSTLKSAGTQYGLLQQPIANTIDRSLEAAQAGLNEVQAVVDSAVIGKVGEAAHLAELVGITPAAGADVTDSIGNGNVTGGVEPPAPAAADCPPNAMCILPTIPPPVPPIIGQPGVPAPPNARVPPQPPPMVRIPVPPVHGGGNWTVYGCCDTGKLEAYPPGDGPVGRVGVRGPGETGPCYLITVLPSQQAVNDYFAAIERDPAFRNGGLIKTICCGKGDWKGERCFGGGQPQPPQQPQPQPPYTPPCPPPPPSVVPPGGTCPPPEEKWCVSANDMTCDAVAHVDSQAPSGMGWRLVRCGLSKESATDLARSTKYGLCQEDEPGTTVSTPVFTATTPMCDPLEYCAGLTGSNDEIPPGPWEGVFGKGPNTKEPGANPTRWAVAKITVTVLNTFAASLGGWIDTWVSKLAWPTCRNSIAFSFAMVKSMTLDVAISWLGLGSLRKLQQPYLYQSNAACPSGFPSAGEISQAWLANTVPENIFRCVVEMNNQCFDVYQHVVYANRRKLTINEGLALYHQGNIKEDEWKDICRQNGVIDDGLESKIELAAQFNFAPADVVKLYQRELIDDEQFTESMLRNGMLYAEDHQFALELNTARFDPDRLIQLHLRGKVTDDDLNRELRQLGWTRPDQIDNWRELHQIIPPYSDLIRLMVRDAADEDIVKQFDLDADFPKKFRGELKEWSEKQGVSEDIMRYMWRAHWQIPSPTQLAEFWRRFRHEGHPSGMQVKLQDIKDALSQQDILPFWQDYYLASQFNPLTRVDVRRAYELGALDIDQVESAYREAGYSDENAEVLTKYTQQLLFDKWKRSPLIRKLSKFEVTPDEARQEFFFYNVPKDQQTILIEYALTLARANTRTACTKQVKTKLATGEITKAEATADMIRLGHDPEFAVEAVDGWLCAVTSKPKQAQAGQLCKWFTLGLINGVNFVERLRTLGWSMKDATALVSECQARIDASNQKAADKALKDQLKAAEKAQKEAQKKIDKARKEQEKAAKQYEAEQTAAERRQKLLVAAAKQYADKIGADISDTTSRLESAALSVQGTYNLSSDQSVQAVVLAVQGSSKDPADSIEVRIDEVAQGLSRQV